jgi:cobalt/nickel transport system ATP-binding protein
MSAAKYFFMEHGKHIVDAVLKVEDLSYTYHDGIHALHKISFDVAKGEKIGIVGANGAGKSTLFTLLAGIRTRKNGDILIRGESLTSANRKTLRRFAGLVFQDPDDQLFCPTVFDDVAFAPLNMGYSPDNVKNAVSHALEQVDLSGYEERSSFHLSYGEMKRVAIATVLSYSPELLLLDEPSANLDPRHRRQIIKLAYTLPQTMLIATHDLDLVLDVCTRCIILNKGMIVTDGCAGEILSNETLLLENSLELPLSKQG